MDETPEELARIRAEADQIDPYRYRRRNRVLGAILLGAVGAGAVLLVLEARDQARNPCDRVRDYVCGRDAKSLECASYTSLARDSLEDESKMAREGIRHQCDTRIKRLKLDQGIEVP